MYYAAIVSQSKLDEVYSELLDNPKAMAGDPERGCWQDAHNSGMELYLVFLFAAIDADTVRAK